MDRLVILSEEAHDAKEAFEKALATERAAETAETIAMLDGAQAATEDLAKGGNAPKKDKLHQKTDVPASALQRRDTSTPPPDPRTLYRSISDADMDMVDKLIGEGHDAEGLTLYRMLTQPLNAVTAAKTAVVVAKVREAEQKIAKIIDAPQKDKLWEKPMSRRPRSSIPTRRTIRAVPHTRTRRRRLT